MPHVLTVDLFSDISEDRLQDPITATMCSVFDMQIEELSGRAADSDASGI